MLTAKSYVSCDFSIYDHKFNIEYSDTAMIFLRQCISSLKSLENVLPRTIFWKYDQVNNRVIIGTLEKGVKYVQS